MNFAEYAKANGIQLELSPHDGRCWRKYKGKMYYFSHPITKAGYDAAVQEWYLLKAKIDGNRPHAKAYQHHQELFSQVMHYWQAFGTPHSERQLHKQVQEFLDLISELLTSPKLEPRIPGMGSFYANHRYFEREFDPGAYSTLGTIHYELPGKWQDRIARMTPEVQTKTPQTITFWIDAYLKRVNQRVGRTIVKRTASNRRHKLSNFKKYADLQAHISTINDDYIEKYHEHIDGSSIERPSKIGYFDTFKMFVRWCGRQSQCDLVTPENLDSKEFSFREAEGTGRKRLEKKKLLWSTEEFSVALGLPQPYQCFCLLMLNCGFRHVDIGQLQHIDVDWEKGRIIIQRHKLNQMETAPVVSYQLWQTTVQSMNETKSDDSTFVFRNMDGGSVENSIKIWWKRNRSKYGLENKRLDQLRKTGSTIIERYKLGLQDFYLGEALSTTARIHYSFNDGEPCEELDLAVQFLGSQFGLADEPTKTVKLTPEVIEGLKKLGVSV